MPHWPELQRTLEHKFWFDELYDALFYRPAAAIAVWLRSDVETPYVEGSLVEIGRAGEEAGAGRRPHPVRAAAHLRARDHRHRRRPRRRLRLAFAS